MFACIRKIAHSLKAWCSVSAVAQYSQFTKGGSVGTVSLQAKEIEYVHEAKICWMCLLLFLFAVILLSLMALNLTFCGIHFTLTAFRNKWACA